MINVSTSLRVNPGSFPGGFDSRLTGVGFTGAGVTQGKDQENGIDQSGK
jgi:hypothetical protein